MNSTLSEAALAERRNFHRVPLVCDVWQRSDAGPMGRLNGLYGKTLNVSDGGALIRLSHVPEGVAVRPEVGQSIDLTLALPRTTADTYLLEHVRVQGEVVRLTGHGRDNPPSVMAVRFGQPMPLQLD